VAPPPASAPPAAAEPREPSRLHRTLPLLAAALIGGIVAGGIVAVVDGSRDTQVTVTNAAAPAPADQGTTDEATPAPPASSGQLPATPPPASSQGGEAQPPASSEQDQQPTAPSPTPASSGAYLGIEPTAVDSTLAGRVRLGADSGVMVAGIAPGSPADGADLEAADSQITIDGQQYSFGGDTITAIDGQQVTSVDQLRQIIGSHKPGDTVKLTVVNANGDERTVEVTLGERPADQQQQQDPQLQPDNGLTPTIPDGLQPPGFEQTTPDDGSAS
jgi:hypothetical protein